MKKLLALSVLLSGCGDDLPDNCYTFEAIEKKYPGITTTVTDPDDATTVLVWCEPDGDTDNGRETERDEGEQ